jgi:hypothetical protein
VEDPDSPPPWWLRPLAIWDGEKPRGWRERVTYLAFWTFVFCPVPLWAAWECGTRAGVWGAALGFVGGLCFLAPFLIGMVGNSAETTLSLAVLYLLLLLFVIFWPRLLEARKRRLQEADRAPSASLQSPPAMEWRRSPHRTSPLAPRPHS